MLNLLSPTGSDVLGHFESRLGQGDQMTTHTHPVNGGLLSMPKTSRSRTRWCHLSTITGYTPHFLVNFSGSRSPVSLRKFILHHTRGGLRWCRCKRQNFFEFFPALFLKKTTKKICRSHLHHRRGPCLTPTYTFYSCKYTQLTAWHRL